MNRDELSIETIEAANALTDQLIADYMAAGMREGDAQLHAGRDVHRYLLEWRALGAEL